MRNKIVELLKTDPAFPVYQHVRRPYRNATVRFRKAITLEDRLEALHAAHLNVFQFRADYLDGCDLLSDSGTSAMTAEQWARLMLGDESYGSNEGYFELKEQVVATFGSSWANLDRRHPNVFLFHQGRAAENCLFTTLARLLPRRADGRPYVIPSNGHFDTTHANLEANGFEARNLFCAELADDASAFRFKGNMDVDALARLIADEGERIPVVFLTVTNNTGGGEPVSMANVRAVRDLTRRAGIPLFLDACRFAENAWFVRQNEAGYRDMPIPAIVHETFGYADGFTISFKKDGISNMGGGLVLKEGGLFMGRFPAFSDRAMDHQILVEGHPTYGGLTGRDIKALVEGLRTVVREDYLTHRITQVQRFGHRLQDSGIPIVTPVGGSAVYLRVDEFFADSGQSADGFPGVALTALLLLMGHRLCELGHFAFGRFDGVREHRPAVNFVRAAVPRLVYEDNDLDNAVEAIAKLHAVRDAIPAVTVTYGRDLALRHMKAHFAFVD
jgi:tryptophanase